MATAERAAAPPAGSPGGASGTPVPAAGQVPSRACRAYKRLHALEAIAEIPRSATGKILRRILKEHQIYSAANRSIR